MSRFSGSEYETRAEIIGVRHCRPDALGNKNALYFPVYQYTDRQGQLVQAEGDWASSAITRIDVGSHERVTVKPDFPQHVCTEAGKKHARLCLFGLLALLPASILLLSFIPGLKTFVFCLATILVMVIHYMRMRKRNGPVRLAERQDLPFVDYATSLSYQEREEKLNKKLVPAAFIVGILLMLGAWHIYGEQKDKIGILVTGTVISNQQYMTEKYGQKIAYYTPRVEYVRADGVTGMTMSTTGQYRHLAEPLPIGSQVPVRLKNGGRDAVIDAQPDHNEDMLISVLLGFLGVVLVVGIPLYEMRSRRR